VDTATLCSPLKNKLLLEPNWHKRTSHLSNPLRRGGCEEIRGPNSSHKTGLTRENCPFFISMPKVLSTGNVGLFSQHPLSRVFPSPCHGVSSVGNIYPVVGFDTMKKFVGLTHLIKPVLQERIAHLKIYIINI
jgi:hypothetical protein